MTLRYKSLFFMLFCMMSIGHLSAQGMAVVEVLPLSSPNNQTNPGGKITLRVKVENDAPVNAPLKIYISEHPTKQPGDDLVASSSVSISGSSTVTFTFDQPNYDCYPNGLYFIAYTSMFDPNEPEEQKSLFFDSATEDLNFRHTWNAGGGIECLEDEDQPAPGEPYITRVGGWIRNDGGCEASEPNARIVILIRNSASTHLLPTLGSGAIIPSISAGGRRYFKFSVEVPRWVDEGDYEMCFYANNANYRNELDNSNNETCKPFAFYPNHCPGIIDAPNTGATSAARLFTVGPNPTRDKVTVNYAPLEGATANVSLVDMNGRTITTTAISTKDQTGQLQFDLSNQVNGIYFVRFQFDNGAPVLMKRIVKQ
jgi:hypothetical protein